MAVINSCICLFSPNACFPAHQLYSDHCDELFVERPGPCRVTGYPNFIVQARTLKPPKNLSPSLTKLCKGTFATNLLVQS